MIPLDPHEVRVGETYGHGEGFHITTKGRREPILGQCEATSNMTGERCKRPVVVGARVCRLHGGSAPHVKAAAAKRLLIDHAPKAVERLGELLSDPKDADPCPFCRRGMPRDDLITVKASTAVLDRAGLGPQSKLEIEAKVNVDFLPFLSDEQVAQMEEWIEAAKARAMAELEAG
jgi:hypothetical protein